MHRPSPPFFPSCQCPGVFPGVGVVPGVGVAPVVGVGGTVVGVGVGGTVVAVAVGFGAVVAVGGIAVGVMPGVTTGEPVAHILVLQLYTYTLTVEVEETGVPADGSVAFTVGVIESPPGPALIKVYFNPALVSLLSASVTDKPARSCKDTICVGVAAGPIRTLMTVLLEVVVLGPGFWDSTIPVVTEESLFIVSPTLRRDLLSLCIAFA